MYQINENHALMNKRHTALPYIINTLGLTLGIEIGVRDGNNLQNIATYSNIATLYGVDIVITEKAKLVEKENSNVILISSTSLSAAKMFNDEYFDFVYIDAAHDYDSVCKDLNAWYPKVKCGGIFSGHDYVTVSNLNEEYGVVEAVEEFVKDNNIVLFLTHSSNNSMQSAERIELSKKIGELCDQRIVGSDNVPNWWFVKCKD